MAGKNLYTAEQFIKAIPGTGGIITAIAKKIGCDWITAKKYITEYKTVQAVYQAEKEAVTDMVEASLITQAKNGEGWAVKFYLTTQGKSRGYVERQEISGPDGGPVSQSSVSYTADEWRTEQERRRKEAAETMSKFEDAI